MKSPFLLHHNSSLRGKIWIVLSLLFITAMSQIVISYAIVSGLNGISNATSMYGLGRTHALHGLLLAKEHAYQPLTAEQMRQHENDILQLIADMEKRFQLLRDGSKQLNIPAATDERVIARLAQGEAQWNESTRPLLEALLVAEDQEESIAIVQRLDRESAALMDRIDATITLFNDITEERISDAVNLQIVFMFIYLLIGLLVFVGTKNVLRTLEEVIGSLGSSASEIMAGTAQQSSGAEEQAAAVSQTTSTVEELLQSASQTSDQAKSVATSADEAKKLGEKGKATVDASIDSMSLVKQQSTKVSENIRELAEQAQSIGDIVATVSEIAEQTNILAINAGIEAARAGEQGSGFAIVAREIKDLAYESKRSMIEIKKILTTIRNATNKAVMGVEEGGQRVDHSIETINHSGAVIRDLVDSISNNARSAVQISTSVSQQVNAISQIRQAMKDVDQATSQTLQATKQSEQVARSLKELGSRLQQMITGKN